MTVQRSDAALRDAALPDLVAGLVNDMRSLVEAEVASVRSDVGDRLVDLGSAIKSWLIALCVAIVTTVLLGLAVAATIAQLGGVPWYAALWIVTAIAVSAVIRLVYWARLTGRKATVQPLGKS